MAGFPEEAPGDADLPRPSTNPTFGLASLLDAVPAPPASNDVFIVAAAGVKYRAMKVRYAKMLAEKGAGRPSVLVLPGTFTAPNLVDLPEDFYKEAEAFLAEASTRYSDILLRHYHTALMHQQAHLYSRWYALSPEEKINADEQAKLMDPEIALAPPPPVVNPLPADLKLISRPDPGSRLFSLGPTSEARRFFSSRDKTAATTRKKGNRKRNRNRQTNTVAQGEAQPPVPAPKPTAQATANAPGPRQPNVPSRELSRQPGPTNTPQPFRVDRPPTQQRKGGPQQQRQPATNQRPRPQQPQRWPPQQWNPGQADIRAHWGGPPPFWPGPQPPAWGGWNPWGGGGSGRRGGVGGTGAQGR